MSEHDVSRLLGRVAAHTPPLDVDVAGVVTVARRRVRRRRVVAAGVAAAALVGAFWFGPGPGLLEAGEISPASVSWEVEEETTVDVLDGADAGGDIESLKVTKTPQGASVTVVADGEEQTIEGQTMAGGADVFVDEGVTVLLWRTPPEAMRDVMIRPDVGQTSSGRRGEITVDGVDLSYWYTVGHPGTYRPEDIVFHDGHQVWTASGEIATTVELQQGDARATGFELAEPPVIGIVDGRVFGEVGYTARNGDEYTVATVPSEAVFARQVRLDQSPDGQEQEVVDIGPAVPTEELPSADLALFDWQGDYPEVQWSADAITRHDQGEEEPAETEVQPGPVGPGGLVRLLDETYVVALDQHDWPELRHEDGTVFLTVTDEDGVVSDGGVVTWRAHWWPWSARHAVHFAVGEAPPSTLGDDGTVQDVVTISGPAGEVTLGAVPAE